MFSIMNMILNSILKKLLVRLLHIIVKNIIQCYNKFNGDKNEDYN